MFLAVPNCPTNFRGIGLCPPAVQLGEIQPAIDEDLHATGSAGLPRTPRCIDPKVDPLDQFLGQHHVVVVEEDHASFSFGSDLRTFMPLVPQASHGRRGVLTQRSIPWTSSWASIMS